MRIWLIFMVLFSMAGCTTLVLQSSAPQNEKLSWNNRSQALSALQAWRLDGLLAIHGPTNAGSVSLQWQQQAQSYHIVLFGPLGTNSYELTGQPGKVSLAAANGQKFVSTSPEQLLLEHTGWHLPVSHLYYWIRGLPVPHFAAEKQFDAYHHIVLLNQEGWSIQFLRYTSVHNIDLPTKIFLNNRELNVRIVISRWEI